jgi:LysM repeat protein
MAKGFDCATKLNATSAANLRAAGYEYAARYLGNSWKSFDASEAAAIIGAGLKLISIFEKNSTYPSYFTNAQGVADANEAMQLAKAAGQPEGTAIYFTVDYNAGPHQMALICDYLDGINKTIKGYDVGLYGHYGVMNAARGRAKYLWQTYAWSGGQTATGINMKQCKNGVVDAGVQIDQNDIYTTVGAWNEQSVSTAHESNTGFIMVVKAIGEGDIRSEPSHTAGFIRNTKDGELFNVVEIKNDWHRVAISNTEFGWIDGNNGQNLYWVDNPALKQTQPKPVKGRNTVVVQSGETVSGIAKREGVTIQQIKLLNGLNNNYLIKAGQNLRIR